MITDPHPPACDKSKMGAAMRVLLTGAAGFIGSHPIKGLGILPAETATPVRTTTPTVRWIIIGGAVGAVGAQPVHQSDVSPAWPDQRHRPPPQQTSANAAVISVCG